MSLLHSEPGCQWPWFSFGTLGRTVPYAIRIHSFGWQCVALAAWFVLASEASVITKIVVSAVFGFGMACYFNWIAGWWIVGLFVLIGLSIFILLYRAVQAAGWSK
jgi:hypothetical protein